MIRALAALIGFAAAAALLAIAPEVADLSGNDLWLVSGIWALAGFVAGVLYQTGGVRRPGLRMNGWLLVLAFLPWLAVTIGLVSVASDPGSTVAGWMRDLTPDTVLGNWLPALSAFAFGTGLLLAFSLIEPLVGVVAVEEVAPAETARFTPTPGLAPAPLATPAAAAPAAAAPAAVREPETVDARGRTAIVERRDEDEAVADAATPVEEPVAPERPAAVHAPVERTGEHW
jgi:hypothetical protein